MSKESALYLCMGSDIEKILQVCSGPIEKIPPDLIYQVATYMPIEIPNIVDTLKDRGVLEEKMRELINYRDSDHHNSLYLLCLQPVTVTAPTFDGQFMAAGVAYDDDEVFADGAELVGGAKDIVLAEARSLQDEFAAYIQKPADQMLEAANCLVENGIDVNGVDQKTSILHGALFTDKKNGTDFWTKFLVKNGATVQNLSWDTGADEAIHNFSRVKRDVEREESRRRPRDSASAASATEVDRKSAAKSQDGL